MVNGQVDIQETVTKLNENSLKIVQTAEVVHDKKKLQLSKTFYERQIAKAQEQLAKINTYLAQFE